MFTKSAHLYDLIYSQFKDYEAEATFIHALIQKWRPGATTILDVGCGTGEHAVRLSRDYGYQIAGIDLEPAFIEIARQKLPSVDFIVADMTDFDLGKRFDVALCLFSAIGYAETMPKLKAALTCFYSHLMPAGVVIVEPWLEPQNFTAGMVHMNTAENEDLKVCRMSRTEVAGNISWIYFEYLVGERDDFTRFSETHQLGLFSEEEMRQAFASASFEVSYQPEGLTGRGIYIGVKVN